MVFQRVKRLAWVVVCGVDNYKFVFELCWVVLLEWVTLGLFQ